MALASIGICADLPQGDLDWLMSQLAGHAVTVVQPGAMGAVEVLFGNPDPAELRPGPLRWLQLESTGFGEYAGAARACRDLVITNLAGFFADPVAETLLAGVLGMLRGVDRLSQLQQVRHWQGGALRPGFGLLSGARVTLIGRGAIIRRLEELLRPFGGRIDSFGQDHDPQALDAALAQAQVVFACLPHTPETEGLISARRVALMGPQTIFANAGRGSLLDEAALVQALHTGTLGGAVLDVTRDEPLPPDSPLWDCPRLLLTQHTGGGHRGEARRKAEWFLANLARWQAGQPLLGRINADRGY